jgi:ubiquinone/menaquinone biosynthesis C-methylase UbiE
MEDAKEINRNTYNLIAKDYVARDQIIIDETKEVLETVKKFTSLLPKGARILDIGIGGGRDSRAFAKNGCEIIGIDVAEKLVEAGKAQDTSGKITYLIMDVEHLDFPPSYFDGVWANASLHHISKEALPDVLKKIFTVLKVGGYLQVKVHKGVGEQLVTEEKFNRNIQRFFAKYDVGELETLVKNAGFSVIYAKTATKDKWVDLLAKK